MFSSKRKSRPPGPMLPPTDPGNASKNALAAASAIGQAIKTGQPIPRSNSLQRTSSLQRSSFAKVPSRSSSLMGLQGPPKQFQQSSQSSPMRQPSLRAQPQRSLSLSTASRQNKQAFTRTSPSLQPGKPRMIKKHVPGPYGLITIEVPAEEPTAPVKKPVQRRTHSLVKPPRPSYAESSSSTRSRSSSNASSKRPVFVDDLEQVKEDAPLEFEQHGPQHVLPQSSPKNNLTFIEEEETEEEITSTKEGSLEEAEKVEGVDDLEKLKLEKEADEKKIAYSMEKDQEKEQAIITDKSELMTPATTLESDKPSSDYENDVLDHYTDLPSTAKSSDTLAAGQSSITTADESDFMEKEHPYSMAQQLRPTIPALYVNNKEAGSNDASPHSFNDANSSIYSGNSIEESSIPSRSEKRSNASPRKSALKHKTASTSNLNLNDSNPASQAYLSLATAENTRLNAMSSSNHSSTSLARSPSNRAMIDKPLNTRPNSSIPARSQLREGNRVPQPQLREGHRAPPRPQSAMDAPRQAKTIQRPQSVQGMRPTQQNPQRPTQQNPQRPQSAQGFRQQPQQSAQGFRQQPQQSNQRYSKTPVATMGGIPKSASNAAALNATLKKNEPRPALEKKSSFEKERPHDPHSAFKRKSLRDPSLGGHHNIESNLGFYRHQAQQQGRAQNSQPAPPPPQNNFNQALEGFSNFKSRFNDSDSEIDVPVSNGGTASKMFAPPPNNPALRKPKSQFTLRSSSVTGLPKNQSPAKSLPEKRATRYFSESDKEKLFNEHLEKAKVAAEDGGKKKSTFGKLKKLFGRSSKD